jgi:acetolactate synthase-1/2/3 large subunit
MMAHIQQDDAFQGGSDLLVAALENEGVDRIFGMCRARRTSTSSNPPEIVDRARPDAARAGRGLHGRHARPAHRQARRLHATLGPGALNFSTGAAYAHLGAMPMIMITGQKAIMSAKQARFQIVDVVASMKPLTKMTRQIVSPPASPPWCATPSASRMEERPGPVHLELPEDIAAEEIEDAALIPPHPLERPGRAAVALDRAAEMILAGQAPAGDDRRGRQPARAPRPTLRSSSGARACPSSTRRWARAPSPAAPTSTWARPRCPSATMSTRLSTAPT